MLIANEHAVLEVQRKKSNRARRGALAGALTRTSKNEIRLDVFLFATSTTVLVFIVLVVGRHFTFEWQRHESAALHGSARSP